MGSPILLAGFLTLGFAEPTITTYAGTGERGYSGDGGTATQAKLDNPFHPAFDKDSNLYFSDTNNHVVRRVDAKTGIITTVAGSGKKGYSGDGGPATKATMNEPYGIALDTMGNLLIVDRLNFCIRRVDRMTRVIGTVAGTGKSEFGGDAEDATKARFREPNGLFLAPSALYIADVKDQRIRSLSVRSNLAETLCGDGDRKTEGDGGPLARAKLNGPRAVTGLGRDLLVVEREGNCVRRLDLTAKTISRFAGTGQKGYTGDGGPALKATFDGPKEICCDKEGNVFVVDTENEAIRRIDAKTGIITTVAGKGKTKTPGLGDGGPATQATLGRPHGVAVGPDGALYIADTLSNRIRVVK
jgi:sugar lactone lactonase YvrE